MLADRGTPATAIGFVSVVSILALFLGRGFILPLVNVSSACFGLTYVVTCLTLLKLRRSEAGAIRAYVAPGGRVTAVLALAVALTVTLVALLQPALAAGGHVPSEWVTLAGWSLAGAALWFGTRAGRRAMPEGVRAERLRGL